MIGCDSISRRGPRPSRCSGALTDFTESHLETWNRTLDPKTYELREAVRPGLWASVPGECEYALFIR